MIDVFNLPGKERYTQVFTVNSSGATGWESWNKPSNISYVHILCIGSGAGGGGGRGSSLNSACVCRRCRKFGVKSPGVS